MMRLDSTSQTKPLAPYLRHEGEPTAPQATEGLLEFFTAIACT